MTTSRDFAIAAAIGALVACVTLLSSTQLGITRDEAYYMKAGELYIAYVEGVLSGSLRDPLSSGSIGRYWSYNTEHPPLMKLLYGASWRLLHRCTCALDSRWHPAVTRIASGRHATLDLMPELVAFRLPAALCFGIWCALVFLFSVEVFGSRVGAAAGALLLFAQPRAFFHAQTANFDLPVAMLWFATTYLYWRALAARTWPAAAAAGLLFGLAMSTKLQSAFLGAVLLAHWGWLAWRGRGNRTPVPDAKVLPMIMASPVVMVALWPWLWHAPIARVIDYVEFHVHHVHYNFEYFGRNYNRPPYPWHEPLGMLVLTAPVILLVLAAAGVALLARPASLPRDTRATRALLLLAGVTPVAIFMGGTVPIYGGTKHWLATMAFVAMAAGYAVDRLRIALEDELGWGAADWRRRPLSVALVIVAVAPAAAETLRSQPYGLSYYNALAGGPPGGADLGMNRQFWGYSANGILPWLNANVPRSAAIFFHEVNEDAYDLYQRARKVRPDIVYAADIGEAGTRFVSDAALVIHEKHFNDVEFRIWETYGVVQPSEVLTVDGVPVVTVYVRPRDR